MGQRKSARVDATIQVRLFGMDGMEKPFNSTAVTKEVSKTGAQIAGVQTYFKPGQTIGFSIAGKKYRCTVVWVGRHDTPLVGHIGVQVQGHITPDWGISFPAHLVDSFTPKRIHESKKDSDSVSYFEYRSERRDAKRQPLRAGARIKPAMGGTPGWGMCTDVSLGGCFIETASSLTAGTRLELTINIENAEIRAIGVVRNRKRNGVGIEFTELTHDSKEHLKSLSSERAKFVQPLKKGTHHSDED
jgi:hypothetical protein